MEILRYETTRGAYPPLSLSHQRSHLLDFAHIGGSKGYLQNWGFQENYGQWY